MEGRASNFEEVLLDFEAYLKKGMYVAVDMELTGVEIHGEPDEYKETAAERVAKMCRIAELHTPIQIGFTIVCESKQEKAADCASYNFFAFPEDGSFVCTPSALKFNAKNGVNLNAWVNDGVPYMTREEEQKRREEGNTHNLNREIGLLRLWKALCNKKLPLVVHGPQDLFFLLTTFEQRQLPKEDPKELANLINRCFPCVFDTSYLHGHLGGFSHLALEKFLQAAKERHAKMVSEKTCEALHFNLVPRTAERYSEAELAHEAGYDSLLTAQLFALLFKIAPKNVQEGKDRLYLYKSSEYFSLTSARDDGNPGKSVFDGARTTVLVAKLQRPGDKNVPRRIAEFGYEYRKMDESFSHILVVINAIGEQAIKQAVELSPKVKGVEKWLPLDQYLEEARRADANVTLKLADGLRRPKGIRPGREEANAVKQVFGAGSGPASCSTAHMAKMYAAVEFQLDALKKARVPSASSKAMPKPSAPPAPDPERVYAGRLKSVDADKGYGFIECPTIFERYNRDVYVATKNLPDGFKTGLDVVFTITLNQRGQPQGRNVRASTVGTGSVGNVHASLADVLAAATSTQDLQLGSGLQTPLLPHARSNKPQTRQPRGDGSSATGQQRRKHRTNSTQSYDLAERGEADKVSSTRCTNSEDSDKDSTASSSQLRLHGPRPSFQ